MVRSTGRRKRARDADSRSDFALRSKRATVRKRAASNVTKGNDRRHVGKGGGRNLKLAIASGVGLAGLVLALIYISSTAFFGLAFVVIMLAQAEFYRAARRAGHHPAAALGLVAGVLILLEVYTKDTAAVALVLFATLVCSLAWYIGFESRHNLLVNVGITMLGVVYIPLLGSFVGLLLARPDGRGVTIATLAAVVTYDIFAYAGGSVIGRRPMARTISPNKTWEGAAVATVGTALVTVAVAPALGPWSLAQSAALGALIAFAAPIGDLVESLVKRDFGIKDMGSIVPGHGGALDRIDAMLFAVPTSWLSLKLFGL